MSANNIFIFTNTHFYIEKTFSFLQTEKSIFLKSLVSMKKQFILFKRKNLDPSKYSNKYIISTQQINVFLIFWYFLQCSIYVRKNIMISLCDGKT